MLKNKKRSAPISLQNTMDKNKLAIILQLRGLNPKDCPTLGTLYQTNHIKIPKALTETTQKGHSQAILRNTNTKNALD